MARNEESHLSRWLNSDRDDTPGENRSLVHRFINSVTNLFPQDLVLSEHSTDGKAATIRYRNCESKHLGNGWILAIILLDEPIDISFRIQY
jgi:hypothetical protein